MLLYVCAHDTIFNAFFWFEFIDTRVLVLARHLALILHSLGSFLTPLNLYVQIPEFGL